MDGQAGQIVNDIIHTTNSELVLFFALFFIALCLAGIPLVKLIINHREEKMKNEGEIMQKRAEMENARMSEILTVVSSNTKALDRLTLFVENFTAKCENDHNRIRDRLEAVIDNVKALI